MASHSRRASHAPSPAPPCGTGRAEVSPATPTDGQMDPLLRMLALCVTLSYEHREALAPPLEPSGLIEDV